MKVRLKRTFYCGTLLWHVQTWRPWWPFWITQDVCKDKDKALGVADILRNPVEEEV